jgi:segregation and condensation protein A
MTFTVNSTVFEGPLDLMLHLIREKKLDLFALDVDVLIDQYIAFIHAMEKMHLEVASEFLVELASLTEYKSRRCLPRDESLLDAQDYEKDTRDELVQRLIEYQKFKEVSETLQMRYAERAMQIAKPIDREVMQMADAENLNFLQVDSYDLIKAMKRCLQRFHQVNNIEVRIAQRELSVEQRTFQLRALIEHLPEPFSFTDLTLDCLEVHMVIVTFLAILDMLRMQELIFTVESDEIWFRRRGYDGYDD